MDKAYNLFKYIKLGGMYLSGLTIFIMMFIIVLDVMLRNIFHLNVIGSYEISQYFLMPLAFFPSLAYVYSSGIMPRLEMIVEKFRYISQRYILIFLFVIELILFLLLTYYGLQYALSGTREVLAFTMRGTVIPFYPVLYFVPLGFLLLSIEIVFLIIKNIMSEYPILKASSK